MVENDQSNKSCYACGESIKATAIKCKHCGSYQGKKRILNVGNVYLGMILAVLTIFSVIIPVSKKYLIQPKTEIEFKIHDVKIDITNKLFQLEVLVTNKGDLQGFLGDIVINIDAESVNGNQFYTAFSVKPVIEFDESIFHPEDHKAVIYSYDHPISVSYGTTADTIIDLDDFEGLNRLMTYLNSIGNVNGPSMWGRFVTRTHVSYSTSAGVFDSDDIEGSELILEAILEVLNPGH